MGVGVWLGIAIAAAALCGSVFLVGRFRAQIDGLNRIAALREQALLAAQTELRAATSSLDQTRRVESQLRIQLAEAQTALTKEQEKHAEKVEAFKETFTTVATSVLKDNAGHFLDLAELRLKTVEGETQAELDAKRCAIENLVKPLGESLKDLKGKVDDLEKQRVHAYAEVATQLTELASANRELRTHTGNLVKALRSPNVRGNWGQMQLRRTVEIAGMLDYCDFQEQVSVETESGRLRPDMVVRLPANRTVVVDAKAPLLYLDSIDARTEEEKTAYLKAHAAQVREHMAQLAHKKYWEQFTPTPEFVIMFLPVEALFAVALQQDATLLEFGAERRVIPASPLTLIALLRAVNYGWKEASLARDATKIQELGRSLYDSVRVLGGHLVDVRDHLQGAVRGFNASVGSVERNFLSRARRLKDFNAGRDEPIPQLEVIDERLRQLEASELRDVELEALVEGVVLKRSSSRDA